MSHNNGCRYTCRACEKPDVCRDDDPSPAEVDEICADCYHQEEPDVA